VSSHTSLAAMLAIPVGAAPRSPDLALTTSPPFGFSKHVRVRVTLMEDGLAHEDVVTHTKILSDKRGKATDEGRKIYFLHLLSFLSFLFSCFSAGNQ